MGQKNEKSSPSFRSDISLRELVEVEAQFSKGYEDFIQMTDLTSRMNARKSRGHHVRMWVIYPEDQFRTIWDLFIVT